MSWQPIHWFVSRFTCLTMICMSGRLLVHRARIAMLCGRFWNQEVYRRRATLFSFSRLFELFWFSRVSLWIFRTALPPSTRKPTSMDTVTSVKQSGLCCNLCNIVSQSTNKAFLLVYWGILSTMQFSWICTLVKFAVKHFILLNFIVSSFLGFCLLWTSIRISTLCPASLLVSCICLLGTSV